MKGQIPSNFPNFSKTLKISFVTFLVLRVEKIKKKYHFDYSRSKKILEFLEKTIQTLS